MNSNIKTKDFTLVIHGPVSLYTVFSIYRHRETFPIVVVIPRPKQSREFAIVDEIQKLMEDTQNNISLFMYDDVVPPGIDNEQNRYYHFFSVYLGLQASKTPYSIKIRSDEFFSDLTPIMSAVLDNKEKIITTDIFFRNSKLLLHPSDHLVAGSTTSMLETFLTSRLLCENQPVQHSETVSKVIVQNSHKINGKERGWLCAEQILGLGVVLSQTNPNKLKEPDLVKLVKELFYIVPANKLGMFRVMFNSASKGPTEYFNDEFFDPETDIRDLDNYE